jgi:hypothetical protein
VAGRPSGALEPAQVKTMEDFAVLLAEGMKTSLAAEQVGIPPSTAYRWVKEPRVQEIIAQALAEIRNRGVRRLSALADKAYDVIELTLDGGDVSPTRHKAATDLLDRMGISRQEIVKHIGSADEPVVIEFNIPVNTNAQFEQEERRRRRAAKQAEVIEGDFEVR